MTQINFNNYKRLNTSYLAKWIRMLGLEKLNIGVCYEDPDLLCLDTSYIKHNIGEDDYLIVCKYPVSKFVLIHELGHIYLWKQLNSLEGFKPNIERASDPFLFSNAEAFYNAILDCFVNYRLCQFEGFNDLLVEFREHHIKENRKEWDNNTFKAYFKIYICLYIESNFIYEKEAKLRLKRYVKLNLKTLRDSAIKCSKRENKKVSYQDFQKIDQVLNRFGKIKNTTDPKDICSFFDSVMTIIN